MVTSPPVVIGHGAFSMLLWWRSPRRRTSRKSRNEQAANADGRMGDIAYTAALGESGVTPTRCLGPGDETRWKRTVRVGGVAEESTALAAIGPPRDPVLIEACLPRVEVRDVVTDE